MAHELEITADGTASMFYNEDGGTPWHGLGHSVHGVLTASKALTAAGLDWTVEKSPVFDQLHDGTFVEVPGRFNVRRSTDHRVFGQVASNYQPYQNEDVFSFFDTVVDSGDAKYETAGSLFGGRRVWMTAKIGETMQVCGEDYDAYLLLTNSHDGTRAFTAAVTPIRAVCSNTVTMALNGAKTRWSLVHRSTLEGKAAQARNALELTFKSLSTFEDEVEKLMAISVTDDAFKALIEDVLPEQKRQKEKNTTELMDIFQTETTVVDTDAAGNAWGAFNAVTFWLDRKKSRSLDGRMVALTEGAGARMRNDVHERLLALV